MSPRYVESRMAFIAPNVSAILGAPIAAKLMGAAGGLTKLSKMPSNNICLLGQSKERRSGFSTATQVSRDCINQITFYNQVVL